MKKAILYVFHGSRLKQSNEEAILFFYSCKNFADFSIQHYSFLELASPTIEEGFEKCIQSGATEIAVVPVLLFSAGHAKKDIPLILSSVKKKYPEVIIRYGQTLSVREAMVDVIEEKVNDTINKSGITNQKFRLILIGRGSKDQEMQRNFQQLTKMVENRLQTKVDYCFLTAAQPLFKDVLENVQVKQDETIIFVPYLLFKGLLLKGIERDLQKVNGNVLLTDYIGQNEKVQKLVVERANEAFLQSAFG